MIKQTINEGNIMEFLNHLDDYQSDEVNETSVEEAMMFLGVAYEQGEPAQDEFMYWESYSF